MQQLKRDIRLKQAAVLQDRALLAANIRGLQERTRQALATPQVLAGSFVAGFAVALLRRRPRPERPAAGSKAHNSRWLRLLLRDVVLPVVLGMLQSRPATEQDRSPRAGLEEPP